MSQNGAKVGSTSFTGWQIPNRDYEARRLMISNIIQLLKAKKPDAPREWMPQLPDMARRLEDKLYRRATTIDEYNDRTTLKNRLHLIAKEFMRASPPTGMSSQGYQGRQVPQHHKPRMHQPGPRPPVPSSSTTSAQQKEMVLRQQQQRLLLLRHASKCPAPPNKCRATQHCAQMKELWAHIAKCKNQQCSVAHCVSSRYVLSHYHRCKEASCAVCGPVRDAIKRHQDQRAAQSQARQQQHPVSHQQQQQQQPSAPVDRKPPVHSQTQSMLNAHAARLPPDMNEIQRQNILAEMARIEEEKNLMAKRNEEIKRRQAELEARQARMLAAMNGGGVPPPSEPGTPGTPNPMLARSMSSASLGAGIPPGAVPPPQAANVKAAGKGKQGRGGKGKGKQSNAEKQATAKSKQAAAAAARQASLKRPGATADGQPAKKRPVGAPAAARANATARSTAAQNRFHAALKSTTSLINTFSREEIEAHIQSLQDHVTQLRGSELKTKASLILRKLLDQKFAWVFNKPVDPAHLNIPDYFDIVKHPMDLGTVKKKLEANQYHSLSEFAHDVRLTFNNAILYNHEGTEVNTVAKDYGLLFEQEYNALLERTMHEEALKRSNENACRLCGEEKLAFEPPVYYCSGKCNLKIRRSATYYSTPDNKMFWCANCYNSHLKDTVVTEDGSKIKKSDLKKLKNSETVHESWVQCDRCYRWYHQICALFNGKKNEQSKVDDPHFCSFCIIRFIDNHKADRIPERFQPAGKRRYTARDLPQTKFSSYLEKRVTDRILKERTRIAKERGLCIGDIEEPGEMNIRVVSCKDTEMPTRVKLDELYKGAPYNYPRQFRYRLKCVLVFEKLQGVDVLIFGMYLQSYGSDCAQPNHRSLYIAYLDSVYYFSPRFLRTPVYQELLIASLAYEKKRGFTKAFIWACPPIAGDDYILYCHPKEQKTPKSEMLRNWYLRLLEDARHEGVVCSLNNLYDAYFALLTNPSGVPNFDGDYWPGVTEQLVEQLENDKVNPTSIVTRTGRSGRNKLDKINSKGHKQKKNKKHKYRKKSVGNVAGMVDDDQEESKSTPFPLPLDEVPQQDALTGKIVEVIAPMKEDFIVVYMHYICVECNKMLDQPDDPYWLPRDFDPTKEYQDHTKRRYAPPYCLCNDCYVSAYKQQYSTLPKVPLPQLLFPPKPAPAKDEDPIRVTRYGGATKNVEASEKRLLEHFNKTENGDGVSASGEAKSETAAGVKKEADAASDAVVVKTEVGSADDKVKTEDAPKAGDATKDADTKAAAVKTEAPPPPPPDGVRVLPPYTNARPKNPYKEPPCSLLEMVPRRADIQPETKDMDDLMDCEFFDTRQQFLSLCQGNRYQFDQLRRAKHSSMMVLYHLHNPDLPAYTHTCNNCRQEIVSGKRYTCSKCSDFDLCEECNKKTKHPHPLQAVSMEAKDESSLDASRREREKRKRSIKLHMQLLVHASGCKSANGKCNSQNCPKMKALLSHGASCTRRQTGVCKTCQRIWTLLQIHARQCTRDSSTCPVPRCAELKRHLRKLAQQQQDRRIRAHRQMQHDRVNTAGTPTAASAAAARPVMASRTNTPGAGDAPDKRQMIMGGAHGKGKPGSMGRTGS